jgi:hypothetical protein
MMAPAPFLLPLQVVPRPERSHGLDCRLDAPAAAPRDHVGLALDRGPGPWCLGPIRPSRSPAFVAQNQPDPALAQRRTCLSEHDRLEGEWQRSRRRLNACQMRVRGAAAGCAGRAPRV